MLIPELFEIHQFEDMEKAFSLIFKIPRVVINIVFGFILHLDCRNEIKNQYLIPILGAIIPIVGLMFYFIEKFTLIKNYDHDK